MNNSRERLGELMRRGLFGRNLRGAWRDFNRRLAADHQGQVSWDAFLNWYSGKAFPATQYRQTVLGDVVGYQLGDEIRRLTPPPFRDYARGVMQMASHTTSRRKQREFPIMPIRDGGGRTVMKAMIVCSQCADTGYHLRRGEMDTDHFFEKEGWLVGGDPSTDKCPQCKKVVHMKEHKKPDITPTTPIAPAAAVPERKQTGTDRLLIGMKIGDNFDEAAAKYRSGWSDAKVAEELELPLDWIKGEREHLYPGSNGDNPDTDAFVKELLVLQEHHTAYDKRINDLTASVCNSEGKFKQLQEIQVLLRKESAHLAEDRDKFKAGLQRLLDIADTLPRPNMKRA